MDDTTRATVAAALHTELLTLFDWLGTTPGLTLEAAEGAVQQRLRVVGAQVLEAGLAQRGTGQAGPRVPCACGALATFEGYRRKEVQTLVGWVQVRRAYYACAGCGHGQAPLDEWLGLGRASQSPGVRRLASRFGALLPFAQAAATLAEATGVQLSASTVRTVTEVLGMQREVDLRTQVEQTWAEGLPPVAGPAQELLYVAMDGVYVRSITGHGMEAKVGVVVPARQGAEGERRLAPSYAVSFEEAAVFGPRLALEAHRRGLERAKQVVVLGDGAAWIWNVAAEHFPDALCIVDWYHASERIWELGRALYGEGTAKTRRWVERQLGRLAKGQARQLAAAWRRLRGAGVGAAVRDEQVTYFTNQASRMAYDRYRALGIDIGSGMVESANKALITMREKGPGMRWSGLGAQAVANVRVLLFNDQWDTYQLAA